MGKPLYYTISWCILKCLYFRVILQLLQEIYIVLYSQYKKKSFFEDKVPPVKILYCSNRSIYTSIGLAKYVWYISQVFFTIPIADSL